VMEMGFDGRQDRTTTEQRQDRTGRNRTGQDIVMCTRTCMFE